MGRRQSVNFAIEGDRGALGYRSEHRSPSARSASPPGRSGALACRSASPLPLAARAEHAPVLRVIDSNDLLVLNLLFTIVPRSLAALTDYTPCALWLFELPARI